MKFKTSAIALAVAGTVAAPMAVQAEGKIYASARIGVHSIENNGSHTTGVDGGEITVASYGSRFGAVGETDLGNGMTGFGRYEVAVANSGAFSGGRKSYVGIKGDFGSLQLGRDYQTFYNHVVGPLDIPWAGSGYAMVAYVGRNSNMIRYDGSAGAATWGIGFEMNPGQDQTLPNTDAEDIDAIELGVSFGLGDMTLGLGLRDVDGDDSGAAEDPDAIFGIALHGIALGDAATLGVSFQSQDDDSGVTVNLDVGSFYVHLESADFDEDSLTANSTDNPDSGGTGVARAGNKPTMVTVGYAASIGRNTSWWAEIMSVDHDSDIAAVEDMTHVRVVLKYDIL